MSNDNVFESNYSGIIRFKLLKGLMRNSIFVHFQVQVGKNEITTNYTSAIASLKIILRNLDMMRVGYYVGA